MAIVANFTAEPIYGEPAKIKFIDTSTGTDGAILGRRIFLQKYDGTFLVPVNTSTQYIEWPLADTEITIDVLDKDYALLITVQWVGVSAYILYDKIKLSGYNMYNNMFSFTLIQMLSANPLLTNDNNFSENRSKLRLEITDGNNAIAFMNDISAAQLCYDRATRLRLNSKYFFNTNS